MKTETLRVAMFFAVGFLAGISLRQDSIAASLTVFALFVIAILGITYLRRGIAHAREVLRILRRNL